MNFFMLVLMSFQGGETLYGTDCLKDIIIFELDEFLPRSGVRSAEVFTKSAIQTAVDPLNPNQKVVKFTISPDYIVHKGNRSELTVEDYRHGAYQFNYRFKIFIPQNYVSETDWEIFAQWHDQPDWAVGETWENHPRLSPPVALEYRDKQLSIVYRPKPKQVFRSKSLAVNLGVWHNVKFDITWSQDQNGMISASVNDVPIQTENGQFTFNGPNIYNAAGNYFKFGIYRGENAKHINEIYFKNMSIYATCNKIFD